MDDREAVTQTPSLAAIGRHEFSSTSGIALFSKGLELARRGLGNASQLANGTRPTDRLPERRIGASAGKHLKQAFQAGELMLYYQPWICRQGTLTGAEALLRWQGRDISPSRFVPLAEQSGLIVPLGHWVLHEACRQKMEWNRTDAAIPRISVNIGQRQFYRDGFVETVRHALEKYALNPAELELELAECMLTRNVDVATWKLRQLKALGVRLAIDDFGTANVSLPVLKAFSVDTLKIDLSLVRALERDARVVRTAIGMAQSLGLEVVAEGVENESQLSLLRRYRCDYYQGFLISEPLPATVLRDVIRKHPLFPGKASDSA